METSVATSANVSASDVTDIPSAAPQLSSGVFPSLTEALSTVQPAPQTTDATSVVEPPSVTNEPALSLSGDFVFQTITATLPPPAGVASVTVVTWSSTTLPGETAVPGWACISPQLLCYPDCQTSFECADEEDRPPGPLGFPWAQPPGVNPTPDDSVPVPTPTATPTSAPEDEPTESDEPDSLPTSTPAPEDEPEENDKPDEDDKPDDNDEPEDDSEDDSDDDNDGNTGGSGGGGGGDDDDDEDDGDDDGFVFPFIIPVFPLPGFPNFPGLPLPRPPWPPTPPPPPPPPGNQDDPNDSDEDEEPTTTASSCTASITLSAHCGQNCVVSPITTTGSVSFSTSCATATCTPTVVCDTSIATRTTTSFSTQSEEPTTVCEPDSCLACGKDGWGKSHEHPPENEDGFDIDGENEDPSFFDERTAIRIRQPNPMRSILQPELTSPETWEDGPEIWWGQVWAMVENKGARSRHERVRVNGQMVNRGLSSMDFSRFGNRGDAGGAGPIWGCTVVVICTDKGIWTSHHWEEPNFILRENIHKWPNTSSDAEFRRQVLGFLSNGELRRPGSSQKIYRGINDLREYLLNNREFLYVRIITPSRVEMGDPWFPQRVWDLGVHLADLLGVSTDEVTTFTFEKGNHPEGHQMPFGMVTWQYAPSQPVEWGTDLWINSRVIRVRFQDEIIFTHVWCPPGVNPPPPPSFRGIRGRQETASSAIPAHDPVPTNAIKVDGPMSCADPDLPCSPDLCFCDDMLPPPEVDSPIRVRQIPGNPEPAPPDEVTIFQQEFTEPNTWPDANGGRYNWWSQMNWMISQASSRLRAVRWRQPDGSVSGRGYSSSDFIYFGDAPGAGGTGPMWGCTSVIILTNNGIYITHHWEDPNFTPGPSTDNWPAGTTHETAFQQYVLDWLRTGEVVAGQNGEATTYFGINDLLEELVNTRTWIDVFIVTPHTSRAGGWRMPSNIPFYPQKVGRLRAALMELLQIQQNQVRILTYPKGRGRWGPDPEPWEGMLSWHYAPFHPVNLGGGNTMPGRGIRLRWGQDLFHQRLWCIPGWESLLPTGAQLMGRDARAIATETYARTTAEWETGTAVPTNAIEVTDMVCEMPTRLATSVETSTTSRSSGAPTGSGVPSITGAPSGTGVSTGTESLTSAGADSSSTERSTKSAGASSTETFPEPTTTIFLTGSFLPPDPTTKSITTSTTRTTSTSTRTVATTTKTPPKEVTGTVDYQINTEVHMHTAEYLMKIKVQVFQLARSMDEDDDDREDLVGNMVVENIAYKPPVPNPVMKFLANEITDGSEYPGEFWVTIDGPLEDYNIKFMWLNGIWSTNDCRRKIVERPVTSPYNREIRYCTFTVNLTGANSLCSLYPEHKVCQVDMD